MSPRCNSSSCLYSLESTAKEMCFCNPGPHEYDSCDSDLQGTIPRPYWCLFRCPIWLSCNGSCLKNLLYHVPACCKIVQPFCPNINCGNFATILPIGSTTKAAATILRTTVPNTATTTSPLLPTSTTATTAITTTTIQTSTPAYSEWCPLVCNTFVDTDEYCGCIDFLIQEVQD